MDLTSKFEETRIKIADKLLLVGTIVSVPAAFVSGYRIFLMGVKPLFIVDILISVILIISYITRSKVNYRIRLAVLLGYVFTLGWISLNTFGLFGLGLFIVFFSIIVTTTFFGLRYGIILLGLSFIILIVFTLSINMSWIHYEWDFNALSHSTYQWFSRTVFFLCFATMAIVTLGMVNSNLEKINRDLYVNENRFNLALDSVNEVVWELDLENNTNFVSKKFFEILKYTPDEMAVNIENWRKLIYEEDKVFVDEKIKEHFEGRSNNFHIEYRIKNKLGNLQWILTKGKIVERSYEGKPLRIVGTHTDISPRKEMEGILYESEQRYRMLFMSATDAILLVENDVIIDTNDSAIEMFGIDRNQLIGLPIWNLCPDHQSCGIESESGIRDFFNNSRENKFNPIEWEFKQLSGKTIDVLMSINPLLDERRTLFQVILHDISERKNFEQAKLNAIVETEERELLKLAGDLHDEVGPLLSSLNMYLSLLKREQTENKPEIIENMQGILVDTIRSVREISTNLSPHALNNYGLVAAINSFIEPGRKLLTISFNENVGEIGLPKVVEINCYRIIKEMLNNTLKYAQAKEVQIMLFLEDNILQLIYQDDGIGFNLESTLAKNDKGIGLLNILNRLNTMKASYTLKSKPNEGFNFEMKLKI